jgi:hypothetical protein
VSNDQRGPTIYIPAKLEMLILCRFREQRHKADLTISKSFLRAAGVESIKKCGALDAV